MPAPTLQQLLKAMLDKGASDLHITTSSPPQLRIDGDLVPLRTDPLTPVDTKQLCYSILTDQQKLRFEEDQELDLSFGVKNLARFRANIFMQRGAVAGAFRIVPFNIIPLEDLGLPPVITDLCEKPRGLVLITGPTGSGKSTTIASMILERAKRRQEHVLTFEDPIEFVYPSGIPSLVSQREIGTDELDFNKSLRAALRQAPDVILVGEIRDGETAEIALQAAETGHVVVATLHTSSAAQTVQRYLKLIPSDRMENAMLSFADSIRGILCQRLLFDENRGKRFPIHELLLPYDSVCGMIRRGEFKNLDQELEAGFTRGMVSFERCLNMRMADGWKPSTARKTGYTEHEVYDFLSKEQLTSIYAAG